MIVWNQIKVIHNILSVLQTTVFVHLVLYGQTGVDHQDSVQTPGQSLHKTAPAFNPMNDSTVLELGRPGELQQVESTNSILPGANTRQLSVFVGSLAITATLLETDQRTYDALSRWKDNNASVRSISPVVTQLGNGVFSVGLFGGLLVYSSIAHDEPSLEAGKLGLESFVLSGVAVQVLKQAFGRERPTAATRRGGTFHGPFYYFRENRPDHEGWTHFDSFPSGHTATAFAAATILSDIYRSSVVTYSTYALATVVGISRITEETHWASDVFVGAWVGYYSVKLVEKLNHGSLPVRVEPYVDKRLYSVRIGFDF
jgi:membrane-associated phospholipid phosphatase